jgi:hypothetical protein
MTDAQKLDDVGMNPVNNLPCLARLAGLNFRSFGDNL